MDVLLYFVLGHRTGRRQITPLFSAEQTVRIKKAFVGENEHCLLARIYSTHLWEGSKFQYVHHFFQLLFAPNDPLYDSESGAWG